MRCSGFDSSIVISLAIISGFTAGSFGIYYYLEHSAASQKVKEAEALQAVARTAPVISVSTSTRAVTERATSTPTMISAKAFNLAVAFFPQAPKKKWDPAHEDYCEEASLLGVDAFLKNKTYSVDEMESALDAMRLWEMKTFGYFESTSIEQTAQIAREYLGYKHVRIIENPTIEMIRKEVAAGKPIIVPANGKMLKNPYFKNGGPVFHMYVVRGFTESGDVIVNDPGTQHGENFVYTQKIVLTSMHDWNHAQDITKEASGAVRVLVLE